MSITLPGSLLAVHITAGALALTAAALAVAAAKGKTIHVNAGKLYFWSMAAIFLTAIPLSIIGTNLFLFLIAIFSFYLAFSGRRFAQNRAGVTQTIDWIAVALMLFSGAGMWLLAIRYFVQGDSQYVVLVVFGFLALSLGYADLNTFRKKTAKGKARISRHLTNMLGGTIAVITAVLVVNVNLEPRWIVWVLPTAVITPFIFYWNARTLK